MKPYLELAQYVLDHGYFEANRTAVATHQVFGSQMRFDLSGHKVAVVTTKQVHLKSVIHELLWMISGDTNIRYLQQNGVRIWNEWADEQGELGPIYGHQWRRWTTYRPIGMGFKKIVIDQLARLVEKLRNAPADRRILLNAWNVGDLDEMKLPPCHMMFQVNSEPAADGGKRLLRLQVYQRSVDVFLGLPFNLAFYSILAHLLAHVTNHRAVELIHVGGNVHIYENHVSQIRKQLRRTPKPAPTLSLAESITDIDQFTYDDIVVDDYCHHPKITGRVAV